MDTDNIYIAQLAISEGMQSVYSAYPTYKKKGFTVVQIRDSFFYGNLIAKDLNTNQSYPVTIPLEEGKIFVVSTNFFKFNEVYPKCKRNLSKRKVLKLGNEFINKSL